MRDAGETISASAFKATCLALLERLQQGKLNRLIITKRGRPMAVLTPFDRGHEAEALFGCMRGSVRVPPAVDLTAPVLDEPLSARKGRIHG